MIVSEGGVDDASALADPMLARAGHKRSSQLLPSIDPWAKDLRKLLVEAGVPRFAEIVCFADAADAAAASELVPELLGLPDVEVWAS